MNKKIINTEKAPAPIGPYNQAVMTNGMLFISGQIAIHPPIWDLITGDIKEEARQVMENLSSILAEAGLDFSHVIKTTIFLSDMSNFAHVNEVYGGYFKEEAPARETVAVLGLPKGVNVEISCIAVK